MSMNINRRSFLGTLTACSAAAPFASWLRADVDWTRCGRGQFEYPGCALVDLKDSSKLRESCAGYEAGLRAIGVDYTTTTAESAPFSPLTIVPGFAGGRMVAGKLGSLAARGSTVLLETGALFGNAPDFADHRHVLRRHFSIDVRNPMPLWEDQPGKPLSERDAIQSSAELQLPVPATMASLPYVDFVWPRSAKIRDFSRVVPTGGNSGEIVALAAGGVPVAVRRRLGRGMVIFLGSPVGPAILSGDREAQEWLRDVADQAIRKS